MLAEIRIRDLALLERVDVEFGPGLNVVSGETGEGKSLLMLAVGLLLGVRARKGLVRAGADQAVVEGRFLLDADARQRVAARTDLLEATATEVCLRRVVSAEGQSRAYLDGSLVPVNVLERLGEVLVDVHGQGDHAALKRPAEQRAILDRYAGTALDAAAYAALHHTWSGLGRDLAALDEREAALRDRRDLLAFHLRELEDLEPTPGEESKISEELKVRQRGADVERALREIAFELTERDSAVSSTVARCAKRAADALRDAAHLSAIRERLDALRIEIEDVAADCERAADGVDDDPRALQALADRLDALRTAARRHRVRGDQLAELMGTLRSELDSIPDPEGSREDLKRRRAAARSRLQELGISLAERRRSAARRLEKEVQEGLAALRMPRARVEITEEPIDPRADEGLGSEAGPGAARFLVAANPGEPAQPLERVASGGETARILLSLRGAVAEHHRVPLLVFDEIDAGVGSRVGVPFGRRIAAIAAHHQVLVITHLAQVAAFAERHLKVEKETREGRTRTVVRVLDDVARRAELASMLGGEVAPEAAGRQVDALLNEAHAANPSASAAEDVR